MFIEAGQVTWLPTWNSCPLDYLKHIFTAEIKHLITTFKHFLKGTASNISDRKFICTLYFFLWVDK